MTKMNLNKYQKSTISQVYDKNGKIWMHAHMKKQKRTLKIQHRSDTKKMEQIHIENKTRQQE